MYQERVLNTSPVGVFYAGVVDIYKHVAVLMNGNDVVSIGTNYLKIARGGATNHSSKMTNRQQLHSVESVHAEADAISRYRKSMSRKGQQKHSKSKLTLWVFRVCSDGTLKNSRPCEGCSGIIIAERKIRKVVFSTNDGFEELKTSKL